MERPGAVWRVEGSPAPLVGGLLRARACVRREGHGGATGTAPVEAGLRVVQKILGETREPPPGSTLGHRKADFPATAVAGKRVGGGAKHSC
jgi:hypothetical protein